MARLMMLVGEGGGCAVVETDMTMLELGNALRSGKRVPLPLAGGGCASFTAGDARYMEIISRWTFEHMKGART